MKRHSLFLYWIPPLVSLPPVRCGLFEISEDHIEKYQSLDARFIRNRSATFFFRAQGDSMEPLILENDILIVDRSITSFHKRIVILSHDGEMYCKRLLPSGEQVILHSLNPKYKDIVLRPQETPLDIFGVVIAIARDVL